MVKAIWQSSYLSKVLTFMLEMMTCNQLRWAAKHGQIEMVKLLLRHGAMKVHPEDPLWARPVEWAKRRSHVDILELLS